MLLLTGPTASGKSGLAIAWALRHGGTVVNADSMQVYRDLRVLTARPDQAEEATVPHRLFGHVDRAAPYSVGQWLRDAEPILRTSGPKVIVGGTGLYFHALDTGLAPVPPIPDHVRDRWRDADMETLRSELERRDPNAKLTLGATDRQRLARAVEVHDATGRTLSEWQVNTKATNILEGRTVRRLILEPSRTELRERIAQRFKVMIEQGALDEVRELLDRGLDPTLPVMRAIGVRELGMHLRGDWSLEHAIERAVIASRQYAKRQSTWFRNRMSDGWERVSSAAAARAAMGLE